MEISVIVNLVTDMDINICKIISEYYKSNKNKYIIHEHSMYTSAIDKYWLFSDHNNAVKFWREMVHNSIDSLDMELYQELYLDMRCKDHEECDDTCDIIDDDDIKKIKDNVLLSDGGTIILEENDYMVFASVDKNDFGRRD